MPGMPNFGAGYDSAKESLREGHRKATGWGSVKLGGLGLFVSGAMLGKEVIDVTADTAASVAYANSHHTDSAGNVFDSQGHPLSPVVVNKTQAELNGKIFTDFFNDVKESSLMALGGGLLFTLGWIAVKWGYFKLFKQIGSYP